MSLQPDVQAALAGAIVAGTLALAAVLATAVFERRRIYEDNQRRDVEWPREKCNEA